jgi:hypothetical protein
LVYNRYLLWLRAGLASPSFSQERTMDAETPKRSATAPTFSASPTFLAERPNFFVPSGALEYELEEGLDKDVSMRPSLGGMIVCLLSIAVRPLILVLQRLRDRGSVGTRIGRGVIRPGLGVMQDGLAAAHGLHILAPNPNHVAALG